MHVVIVLLLQGKHNCREGVVDGACRTLDHHQQITAHVANLFK